MTDTIALSWSSLGAIAAIVAVAMGAVIAYVHMVVEVKLARRDQRWREWGEMHFRTLDASVQKPILSDKSKVVMLELEAGVKRFLEDMEAELSRTDE